METLIAHGKTYDLVFGLTLAVLGSIGLPILLRFCYLKYSYRQRGAAILLMFLSLCVGVIIVISLHLATFESQSKKMSWINNEVIPYLENLPVQAATILKIKYISFDQDASKYLVELTVQKDDNQRQHTFAWVSVKAANEDELISRIVYQELTYDLPHDINSGYYHAVLLLDTKADFPPVVDLPNGDYPQMGVNYGGISFFFLLTICLAIGLITFVVVYEFVLVDYSRIEGNTIEISEEESSFIYLSANFVSQKRKIR
jgi:hypothetical protein